MTATATPTTRVDRFLHETWNLEARSLGVFRIVFGLYVLLLLFPVVGWINDLPGSWFEPPFGPLLVFESVPSSPVVNLLVVVAAAALVGVVIGWRTQVTSLVAAASLMVLFGLEYSFGKIDHTTFVWFVPALMAFSDWGTAWSVDATSGRAARHGRGWPVALLLLTLSAAMATAGVAKIRGGWLDLSYSATRAHQLNHVVALGDTDFLAVQAADNNVAVVDELLDWFTVIWEMSFLVAMWRRSWMRWAVAIATFFHLGVVLMLNIAFMMNFCAYGLVVDWSRVADAVDRRRDRVLRAAGATAVVAAVFALFGHPFLRWVFEWSDRGDLWISTIFLVGFAATAAVWMVRTVQEPTGTVEERSADA